MFGDVYGWESEFAYLVFALQLHWSLSLSEHLIVALEDASLIQMNVDVNGSDITVQGRRSEVLSPVKVRKLRCFTAIQWPVATLQLKLTISDGLFGYMR